MIYMVFNAAGIIQLVTHDQTAAVQLLAALTDAEKAAQMECYKL